MRTWNPAPQANDWDRAPQVINPAPPVINEAPPTTPEDFSTCPGTGWNGPVCQRNWECPVPSDGGISGIGNIIFWPTITGIVLLLTLLIMLLERDKKRKCTYGRRWLKSLTNGHALTGILSQSVALCMIGAIVPYHFTLIFWMSLLVMASNSASLIILYTDFRRNPWVKWSRVFFMFLNWALSTVIGVFHAMVDRRGLGRKTLPMKCLLTTGLAAKMDTMNFIFDCFGLSANFIMLLNAMWYLLRAPKKRTRQKVFTAASLLMMVGFGITATVMILTRGDAFGKPIISLKDKGEEKWNYGQTLAVCGLFGPVIHEHYNIASRKWDEKKQGQKNCAGYISDSDGDDEDDKDNEDGEDDEEAAMVARDHQLAWALFDEQQR